MHYLPEKFDSIVQTILRWSDDKFVFKDILVELISEESRIEWRDNDWNTEFFLESHHTCRLKYITACFRCGESGHISRFCGKPRKSMVKSPVSHGQSRSMSPYLQGSRSSFRQYWRSKTLAASVSSASESSPEWMTPQKEHECSFSQKRCHSKLPQRSLKDCNQVFFTLANYSKGVCGKDSWVFNKTAHIIFVVIYLYLLILNLCIIKN